MRGKILDFLSKYAIISNNNQIGSRIKVTRAEFSNYYRCTGGYQPELVKALFSIEGLTEVALRSYEIWVDKGSVFEWDDLIPKILPIIKTLSSDGKLKEKLPCLDSRYYCSDCGGDEE